MSVPHPLSGESCCYYHGYVLAEMAVQQTRAHFLATYGGLVDRPEVGRDLAEGYWRPGNTEPFLGLVARLTGAPLAADAWVAHLCRDLDARCAARAPAVHRRRRAFTARPAVSPFSPPVDKGASANPSVRARRMRLARRPRQVRRCPFLLACCGRSRAAGRGRRFRCEQAARSSARVAEERRAYDEAAAAGPAIAPGQEPDLGMRVILCHGDETIGDSEADGGLAPALAKFKAWVRHKYFSEGKA
jgi:hypothetical protein